MPPILINRSGVLELADRTVMSVAAQSLQRITVKGEKRDELVERKAVRWATSGLLLQGADVEVLQRVGDGITSCGQRTWYNSVLRQRSGGIRVG